MTLARQFVKAEINELIANTWQLLITYSYYGLYQYSEAFIFTNMNEAVQKLAIERCGGALRITDANNVNVVIGIASSQPAPMYVQQQASKPHQ